MPTVNLDIVVTSNLAEELDESAVAGDKLQTVATDLSKTVSTGFDKASKSAANLTKEEKKQAKAVDSINDELAEMTKRQKSATATKNTKKFTKQVSEAEKELEKLGKTGEDSFDEIEKGAKDSGNEVSSAFSGLGAVIGGAFAIGGAAALLGEVSAVSKQFQILRGEIAQLTDLSGDQLDDATEKVAALGTTFDRDYKDILLAANAVSKEFGITLDESLSQIETGFLSGADANGELLDSLREYSTQVAASGGTIDNFLSILNTSATEGVFSDKGIDVVKEFGLRIREQADGTRDALENAFGSKFADDLFGQLNSGAITTIDALKLVSSELSTTDATASEVQTVIADVFGGAGEDAGLRYLQSLKDIQDESSNLVDENNELVKSQIAALGANERLAEAQNELSKEFSDVGDSFSLIFTEIKIIAFDAVTSIISFFKEFKPEILAVAKVLGVVVAALLAYKAVAIATAAIQKINAFFTTAWTIATKGLAVAQKSATASQFLLNAAMNANPVGLIVAAFVALAAILLIVNAAINKSNSELSTAALKAQQVEKVTSSLTKAFTEEATEVDKTFNKLQDSNTTREEYLQILEDLEAQYDITLDDLRDENGLLTDVEAAQRRVNEAVLDGIIAKQKAEEQNARLAENVKAQVALANLEAGVVDETAEAAIGVGTKIGNFFGGLADNFVGTFQGVGQLIQGDAEAAILIQLEAQQRTDKRIQDSRKVALEGQIADNKAALEVIDEVYAVAGEAINENLGDLALSFADGLEETTTDASETAKKLTEDQKRESEKRRKQRLQENNALFKVQQDFLEALQKLEEKVDKEREKNAEGLELIAIVEQAALDEVAILEDALKEKLALIDLEAQLTREQLSKISDEEKKARIDAFKENVELEEQQLLLLNELRGAAISSATQERIKFEREQQSLLNSARLEGIEEQFEAQELFEESLLQGIEEKRKEFGDSELAFEAFKEEETLRIKQSGFERRVELINAELELKLAAIDIELAALEGKDDAESKARVESLEQQRKNVQQATDNTLQALNIEQEEIQIALAKIAEEKSKFNLGKALGLTPEEFESLKAAVAEFGQALVSELTNSLNAQLEANDKLLNSLDANIDDTEAALEREIAKRDAGFASNIAGKENELNELKKKEEEALKEREKLQKQQLILDSVQQASGLITTSIGILQGFSAIPIVGLPLGIAAVATLFGFFLKAKAAAFSAAGFYDGQYTGDGNERNVAGVVHFKEFVSTAKTTKKHRPLLQALHDDDMPRIEQSMADFLLSRGITLEPDLPDIIEAKHQEVKTFQRVEASFIAADESAERLQSLENKLVEFMKMVGNKPERWQDDNFTYKKVGNKTIRTKRK